jgi:hypothetical protein
VARAPITAWANNLSATAGQSFSNQEVAAFTDPNANDLASGYSATVNWGDGTQSTGSVTGSAGFFDILAGHLYSSAGVYRPTVQLLWSGLVTQAVLLSTAVIQQSGAPSAPVILGPTAVPGNSIYRFSVTLTKSIKLAAFTGKEGPATWTVTGATGKNQVTIKDRSWLPDPNDKQSVKSLYADLQFANSPQSVTISGSYQLQGAKNPINFEMHPVDLVRIVVITNPSRYQQPFPYTTSDGVNRQITLKAPFITSDVTYSHGGGPITYKVNGVNIAIPATDNLTAGDGKFDKGGFHPTNYGLAWTALLSLTGPDKTGKRGIDQLHLGFIQHVQPTQWSVRFDNGKTWENVLIQGKKAQWTNWQNQKTPTAVVVKNFLDLDTRQEFSDPPWFTSAVSSKGSVPHAAVLFDWV